jgi:hypothetical protein
MYIKTTAGKGLNNKSSCSDLMCYLSKEDETAFKDKNGNVLNELESINLIDKNTSGLHRNSARFYMITVNPSSDEILHLVNQHRSSTHLQLIEKNTPKSDLSFESLSPKEKEYVIQSIEQKYIPKVMDNYARAFHRNGITDHQQLVYVSKVEINRTYKHNDKSVLEGTKIKGQQKDGFNVHVHVVVSRMDVNRKIKLNPAIKNKNDQWRKDGQSMTRGFVLKEFQVNSIADFNNTFNYSVQNKYLKSNYQYLDDRFAKCQVQHATGILKGKLVNTLSQGHFGIEKELIGKSSSTLSWTKTTVALATNPILGSKEALIKAARAILDKGMENVREK